MNHNTTPPPGMDGGQGHVRANVESNFRQSQPPGHGNGNPPHFFIKENRRYVNHRQAYARHLWEKQFGPVPPGYEVHHRNGNAMDDRLCNLALIHRSDHAKLERRRPVRIYADDRILAVRRMIEEGAKPEDAATSFGISARLGRHIAAGTRHAELCGVALHGRHADGTPDLFGPDRDTPEDEGGDT